MERKTQPVCNNMDKGKKMVDKKRYVVKLVSEAGHDYIVSTKAENEEEASIKAMGKIVLLGWDHYNYKVKSVKLTKIQ